MGGASIDYGIAKRSKKRKDLWRDIEEDKVRQNNTIKEKKNRNMFDQPIKKEGK